MINWKHIKWGEIVNNIFKKKPKTEEQPVRTLGSAVPADNLIQSIMKECPVLEKPFPQTFSVFSGCDVKVFIDGSESYAIQGFSCFTDMEKTTGSLIQVKLIGNPLLEVGKIYKLKLHGQVETGQSEVLFDDTIKINSRNYSLEIDDLANEIHYTWIKEIRRPHGKNKNKKR